VVVVVVVVCTLLYSNEAMSCFTLHVTGAIAVPVRISRLLVRVV